MPLTTQREESEEISAANPWFQRESSGFFNCCRNVRPLLRRITSAIIPFSAEFRKCSRNDFKEAFVELLVTTIFSTMPLWVMPILGPIMFSTDTSFTDQLLSTIRGGELYVYCAALIGPLIYIITRRYGEVSGDNSKFSLSLAFPHGISFIFFSIITCLFAGFAFGLLKNPVLNGESTFVRFNSSGIFWSSLFLYIISLWCFFSASTYRNAMAGFVKSSRDEEDAFAAAWEGRSDVR